MKQEFNRFRSLDDNTLQRDIRRTNSPKSPLDKLPLATRHEIFFRKVEDTKSPKSLPGDNNQKHWDINQQNKVAKERKEYQENSCTADESFTQARVEHVSQAKTGRREGFAALSIVLRFQRGSHLGVTGRLSNRFLVKALLNMHKKQWSGHGRTVSKHFLGKNVCN